MPARVTLVGPFESIRVLHMRGDRLSSSSSVGHSVAVRGSTDGWQIFGEERSKAKQSTVVQVWSLDNDGVILLNSAFSEASEAITKT